jgi:hypothetical protein
LKNGGVAALLLLALLSCESPAPSDSGGNAAGGMLERAAMEGGIVADPSVIDPVGAYASETDRVCVIRADRQMRLAAVLDYGDGHGCAARGVATGRERLRVDLGEGCRFEARFDGERLSFPAAVPAACDRKCTGRASFSALNAPRLSGVESEARAMRTPNGQQLCN